jgi:hypothetical protein
MSRLTGTDAKNLMEAYTSVYTPQELTEDQIWEEVENWVNSLLEEGYDLSDYTWEEMYESYIEEQGSRSSRGASDPAVQARWRAIGNTLRTGNPEGRTSPRKPTGREVMRQKIQQTRPGAQTPSRSTTSAPARPAPAPRAAAPAAPAPARPAARPAAAPARPAADTPAARPASAPTTSTASAKSASVSAPARPSLAQQAGELRAMRQRSQERQTSMKKEDIGIFDVIKGYLLDEGYADSEEAALAIMANMSEEWRQSIVEADSIEAMKARAAKRRQQRYGKSGGGRDDFRPYTKDDYNNPKPGYGSGAASQAKDA